MTNIHRLANDLYQLIFKLASSSGDMRLVWINLLTNRGRTILNVNQPKAVSQSIISIRIINRYKLLADLTI